MSAVRERSSERALLKLLTVSTPNTKPSEEQHLRLEVGKGSEGRKSR